MRAGSVVRMEPGASVTLAMPFADAVEATRSALAAHGFGVITEIDMQATMKNKLDQDYPPFLILGACNPGFAHRALGIDPTVATLLPCNVVVRGPDGAVEVSTLNPQVLVAATGSPELEPLAEQLAAMLSEAFAELH